MEAKALGLHLGSDRAGLTQQLARVRVGVLARLDRVAVGLAARALRLILRAGHDSESVVGGRFLGSFGSGLRVAPDLRGLALRLASELCRLCGRIPSELRGLGTRYL